MDSLSTGGCSPRERKALAQGTLFSPPSWSSSCRPLIGLRFDCGPNCGSRRNVVLGHVLVFIGELSMFFVSALAVVILFDRGTELGFVLWKVFLSWRSSSPSSPTSINSANSAIASLKGWQVNSVATQARAVNATKS